MNDNWYVAVKLLTIFKHLKGVSTFHEDLREGIIAIANVVGKLLIAWVTWAELLLGLRGLHGSKYFLRRTTLKVVHNFYVGFVGVIYLCGG